MINPWFFLFEDYDSGYVLSPHISNFEFSTYINIKIDFFDTRVQGLY